MNQFSLRKYTFFSKVLEAGVTSFAFEYMLSQWDAGAIKFLHGTSDDKRYDAMAIHLIADSQAIRDHHIVIWDKEHKHLSCHLSPKPLQNNDKMKELIKDSTMLSVKCPNCLRQGLRCAF